jgi:hypothetical protein
MSHRDATAVSEPVRTRKDWSETSWLALPSIRHVAAGTLPVTFFRKEHSDGQDHTRG